MLTEKDYCDYDTCVALKELGFDQYSTLRTYAGKGGVWLGELPYLEPDYKEGDLIALHHAYGIPRDGIEIAAPSLYEAQKWLRKEKEIEIVVHSFDYVGEPYFADIHMYREVRCACSFAESYEEALLEGVRASIKILQDEQKENN